MRRPRLRLHRRERTFEKLNPYAGVVVAEPKPYIYERRFEQLYRS
jgi:hypothetical protein